MYSVLVLGEGHGEVEDHPSNETWTELTETLQIQRNAALEEGKEKGEIDARVELSPDEEVID